LVAGAGIVDDAVKTAVDAIHADLTWLMDVGYGEHSLPQERNSATVHVPMPPRLRENLQILANHRSLPYGASLHRLMLHAAVVLGYELATALAENDPEMQAVVEQIEWDREMKNAAEQAKRESMFQTYLNMQEKRLNDYIKDRNLRRVGEVLNELMGFVSKTKDDTLRHRLTRLCADSSVVNDSIGSVRSRREKEALNLWLESAL